MVIEYYVDVTVIIQRQIYTVTWFGNETWHAQTWEVRGGL